MKASVNREMARIKAREIAEGKTISEAFEEFVTEKIALNKSKATITNYRYTYKAFCKYHNYTTDEPITDVDSKAVYSFVEHKRDEARTATIQHYARDLRAWLYWCMDKEYLEQYKIEIAGGQEPLPKNYSDEDIVKLLEKPERSNQYLGDWRSWLAVNWVLATGNRVDTLLNVRMSDIDLKHREVAIRTTKTNKPQIIPLTSSIVSALQEYIKRWRYDAKPDDYLFCSIENTQIQYSGFKSGYKRYCVKRGVSQYNIHGLRHSFAKKFIENGGNEFALMKMLGHTNIRMTQHYVSLYGADLEKTLETASPLEHFKVNTKHKKIVKKNND